METIHPLVYVGLLLILSHIGGKAASFLNAPRVTGYLVVGMLLSPSLLGLFHESVVKEELTIITDIALSIIAFSIGGSLSLIKLKRLGKHIFWITFTQAFGAFISTTLMLSLFFYFMNGSGPIQSFFRTLYFPMAFVIGAISAATAPAAIMAIVHEYSAKGPFTTILLGIIALDDALTILFAAFAFTMAQFFVNQQAASFTNLFFPPMFSIFLSLIIGGVLGICLRKLIGFVLRKGAILGVIIGAIFLAGGLAISLNASPLLANMMMGFVVVNFVKHREDLFAVVESIEEPIFGMFFTLAGAHMDFKVMQTAGLIALVIVVGRFGGKLLGSRFGAQISGAPETVKKYLGMALLPKAGVTVGLALGAGAVLGDTYLSEILVSAVLGSVIINELIAPFFVRFSLRRAGEA